MQPFCALTNLYRTYSVVPIPVLRHHHQDFSLLILIRRPRHSQPAATLRVAVAFESQMTIMLMVILPWLHGSPTLTFAEACLQMLQGSASLSWTGRHHPRLPLRYTATMNSTTLMSLPTPHESTQERPRYRRTIPAEASSHLLVSIPRDHRTQLHPQN